MSEELLSYVSGISWFQRKAGTVDQMRCRACGAICDVERHVPNDPPPRPFRLAGPRDVFSCPRAGEAWHTEAEALTKEMVGSHSKRIRDLIFMDLVEFLAEQGVRYEMD